MSQRVRLWDFPTRLFHWVLVVLCLAMMVTGELDFLRLHMLIGPAILVLILFRIVWGFVGSTTSRFTYFVKGPKQIQAYIQAVRSGQHWPGLGHNPLGALSVLALLGLPVVMVATGLFSSDDILTDAPLVPLVSSAAVKLLSGLHGLTSGVVMLVVGVHLAAILFYRFVKHDDLIWPMIVGTKQVDDADIQHLHFVSPWAALPIVLAFAAIVWGGLWYLTAALQ